MLQQASVPRVTAYIHTCACCHGQSFPVWCPPPHFHLRYGECLLQVVDQSSELTLTMMGRRLLFISIKLVFFLLGGAFVTGAKLSPEITTLLQIKEALGNADSVVLSSWDGSNPLCQWRNIQWTFTNGTLLNCSSSSSMGTNLSLAEDPTVAAHTISLAAAGLNGSLPGELSKLSSLKKLDLNSNKLVGAFPLDLGNSPSLELLYLSKNELTSALPSSLWNLCTQVVELHLDHNAFSGGIPSPAAASTQCPFLQAVDVSSNQLSGSIPSFLGSFQSLRELNFSNNSLSGGIPKQLAGLSNLTVLDVAYNNLSGDVPAFAGNVDVGAEGNPGLCGAPLTTPCSSSNGNGDNGGKSRTELDPRLVAGLVIGSIAASVVLLAISVAMGHKHNWGRNRGWRHHTKQQQDPAGAKQQHLDLDDDVGDGKLVRFEGGEHLTVEEVLNAPGEVLGKTSYGTVYKAKLSGGGMIALRLLREDTVKERHYFVPAIQQLGLIRYPNIVSLLAYYAGPQGEKLLVYNYLSRGSLADLLHERRGATRAPLTWAQRHKIALGAARGLAYLHHGLHQHHHQHQQHPHHHQHHMIVHGNLKSKNIMVDESFEGHLADYGLPLLMNGAAQRDMVNAAAAQGYRPPELHSRNHRKISSGTDVYNFGIVLLEILTGKRPKEAASDKQQRPPAAAEQEQQRKSEKTSKEQVQEELPTIVKAAVLEERVSELFDLEMMASSGSSISSIEDGLLQTLQLAMGCCAPSPSVRPDIKEVVRQLEEIRPKIPTPLYTPTGMKTPRDFTAAS